MAKLSDYQAALDDLKLYPHITVLASRHLAAIYKVNQVRLLDLHKIFN